MPIFRIDLKLVIKPPKAHSTSFIGCTSFDVDLDTFYLEAKELAYKKFGNKLMSYNCIQISTHSQFNQGLDTWNHRSDIFKETENPE